MVTDRAFDALGDPTRRAVLELLAGGPRAVGDVAAHLPVSRPAVSQHLRVLKDAGLVVDQAAGTRRLYQVDPHGVGAMRAYLDRFTSGPGKDPRVRSQWTWSARRAR